MTISLRAIVATALFSACAAVPAGAQTGAAADRPLFVDISAGIGAKPSAVTTGTTFTIFGEAGSAATEIASGLSALADFRVGYHVHPRVAIAAALSGGQSTVTAATTASVPNPIRFSSPSIVSLEAPEAKRREIGVHLQAIYALPLTPAVLLTIAGGPSLVHLQQGMPGVTISGTTPTIVPVNESGNGFGGHVGADLSTFFSERYGFGVFVRYVAAKVDLPSASGVTVGGVQAGAGLRLRF
jgi:outer membrane protein with beta-barrel domain